MPRRPLGEISSNIRRKEELTPYTRSRIAALREEGVQIRHISERLQISENTIKWTIKSNPSRNEGKSLQRSERPPKYTKHNKRHILQYIQLNPKATYEDIKQNICLNLSHDTFCRILNSAGIKNWRAKARPYLDTKDAKVRRIWALAHQKWIVEWESIIFSDECSVEKGAGARRQWVFRLPSQKWSKDMVQTYKKSKDISIMIWGAI
jgi:transposase